MNLPIANSSARRACVIGAGFGGLALAIRLQSAGIETTIIEARDKPGGRAYFWERDGFVFDAGPTVITDPPCLKPIRTRPGSVSPSQAPPLHCTAEYKHRILSAERSCQGLWQYRSDSSSRGFLFLDFDGLAALRHSRRLQFLLTAARLRGNRGPRFFLRELLIHDTSTC